ncbi:MAG: adventurous gliding motility protein U, partial [Bdellovibrio sp.]|nr:adventurous gliding motility protein U [Bdellovibrio sp.]
MKFNNRQLVISSLITALMAGQYSPALAATTVKTTTTKKVVQKKTVGDLLNQANQDSRGSKAQMTKTDTALPTSNMGFAAQAQNVNLESVKPPRSSEILQSAQKGNADRIQYEKILDQQINELFKLTQRFKTSPNRGELWLRLAELYVEKAGVIDSRQQDEYDAKLRAFQQGKTKHKPVLDIEESREYNKKAVQ